MNEMTYNIKLTRPEIIKLMLVCFAYRELIDDIDRTIAKYGRCFYEKDIDDLKRLHDKLNKLVFPED